MSTPRKIPNFPHMVIPAHGVIRGGQFDGRQFTFKRLLIVQDQVELELLVPEPNWPFPQATDLKRLKAAMEQKP